MMDYASLRREGLRQLERLTGGQWTDFNAHDPGITVLEQLCYALTDLSYRTGYAIPELLAEGGSQPYANLHPPAAILTCRPVTRADFRRLVLDVVGVKNAWIEVIEQSSPTLYYHPDNKELSLLEEQAPAEPVTLLGLYRVLIEAKEDATNSLVADVAQRLHQNRSLCEDFAAITVLTPQYIRVDTMIEVGLVDNLDALAAEIEQRIADEISPPIAFASLAQLLRAGLTADEIFAGPRLNNGFITDEVLQRATRRTAVNTSDLIHSIMDAAGVRAVRQLRIGLGTAGPPSEPWSLAVDPDKVPRLHRANSNIVLLRDGKRLPRAAAPPVRSAPPTPDPSADEPTPPRGRDRQVSRYWSVQNHLPALYGVGELGLPAAATPERRAQAKQLKAYLLFFDQLMANHLAQLAHIKDLFALGGTDLRTYFTQALELSDADRKALLVPDKANPNLFLYEQVLSELEDSDDAHERKSRFLNHLLARFAETLDEHGARSAPELLQNKQALLQAYPQLSSARGTAFNYLAPADATNRSGLEQRLRVKLGLSGPESLIVVEHILLRPMEGDELQLIPLLSAALHQDPYSLQLTCVLPYGAGRFPQDENDPTDFAGVVEQLIREETPAHLTAHVRWMSEQQFKDFAAVYAEWLERRRQYVAEQLNVKLSGQGG